jgi:hypothetical protein
LGQASTISSTLQGLNHFVATTGTMQRIQRWEILKPLTQVRPPSAANPGLSEAIPSGWKHRRFQEHVAWGITVASLRLTEKRGVPILVG